MFVHFKRSTEAQGWDYLGCTHSESEDAEAINCPLPEEEYIKWMTNPALFRKYEPVLKDGEWILLQVSERAVEEDRELVPYTTTELEDDPQCDVLLVLTEGTALVHMFNERMANDAKCAVQYYLTEADDHSAVLHELGAAGTDNVFENIDYDPKNVRAVVRNPFADIVYGFKIV